jgi:uncharacterized membrane protein
VAYAYERSKTEDDILMHEIASIVIHCPAEEVYQFLSEPQNRLKYDPDLIAIRHTPDGPLRLGTQIVESRRFMGRKGTSVTEVSELEPNRVIGYRSPRGDPTNAFGAYHFDTVPEGTRLTLDFTLAPRGMIKLVTPFIAGRLRRDITAGLRNIKAVLENQ